MKIFDHFMGNPYWKSIYVNAPSSECREYYRIMFEYFSLDTDKRAEAPGISAGTACFLVRDESLKTWEGEFWDYLKKEGFESWGKKGHWGCEWVYVNVNSKLFAPGMPGIPVTKCVVSKDPGSALTIDEFKSIWEILKRYSG